MSNSISSLHFRKGHAYKYVIHHHIPLHTGAHYDLRIENDINKLTDFASNKLTDAITEHVKILLFKQKMHPKWFLDYEGELKGYGIFKIWDQGIIKVLNMNDSNLLLEFSGYKTEGCFVIIPAEYEDSTYLFYKVKCRS